MDTYFDYEQLLEEYISVMVKVLEEAMIKFPSKHLANNNEDEWFKVVEQQADYSTVISNQWLEDLKSRFNLKKRDWKGLVSKLKTDYLSHHQK